MRVLRFRDQTSHRVSLALLDDAGQPMPAVAGFLGHLGARGFSPNTLSAYAHELLHFVRFLGHRGLAYADFTPVEAVVFLEYLSQVPSRKRAQALDAGEGLPVVSRLAPGERQPRPGGRLVLLRVPHRLRPVPAAQEPDRETADLERVSVAAGQRPAMGAASRQRPIRRVVRVRTVERLPAR